ncbi:MAG TPA: SWIM zinc finger family protein, partial [Chroococcales cyanobacterium]
MKPVTGKRKTLSLQAIQQASSEPVYRRGVQYYRRKKVLKYEEQDGGARIEALVIGSEPQPYKVVASVDDSDHFKAECSCPYFEEVCKHSVAVLLTHIARANPGIRFDVADVEKPKEHGGEKVLKAKEILEDARAAGAVREPSDFTLGVLVLEKPLALIIGTVPEKQEGKVNILKVPPEVINIFEPDSRMHKLVRYLTSLPQTTRGTAGG